MDPFLMAGMMQAGSGLLGGLLGNAQQQKANKMIEELFKKMQLRTNDMYGLALKNLMSGDQLAGQGFDNAKAEFSRGGNQYMQDLLGLEQQRIADQIQGDISRGTYGTTSFDNSRRGIYSDTNRALGQYRAGQASGLANLAQNKGMALAGGKYQIANLYPQWLGAKNAITDKKLNMIAGAAQNSNNWLGGLTQGFGNLAGQWAGQKSMSQMLGGGY